MNILLDTVSFLWIITDAPALSSSARKTFQQPENDVYLSVVSVWEIAVKVALGKLVLPAQPMEYVPAMRRQHAIKPLDLEEAAALQLEKLPALHRDPFDRMLVCQAIEHGMSLLTPDAMIRKYPVRTIW